MGTDALFDACAVNGTWQLRIAADTAGGLGTLHCWSLLVFPTVCQSGGGECDPPCPGCLPRLEIAHESSSNDRVVLRLLTIRGLLTMWGQTRCFTHDMGTDALF